MKAFVYWNLHRKCWSIKSLERATYGLVVGHATSCTLEGVTCKVSEAGRQRVLREGKKNVHAGLAGRVVACGGLTHDSGLDLCEPTRGDVIPTTNITYNPRKFTSFVTASDLLPVSGADVAQMNPDRTVQIAQAEYAYVMGGMR